MTLYSSRFIVLEGLKGAGKTKIANMLEADFNNNFPSVNGSIRPPNAAPYLPFREIVTTREVGGTEEGEIIRQLFTDINNVSLDGETELLLINAARRHHLRQVIYPALSTGHTLVLCERYIASTYAFQYGVRGVSERLLFKMHENFCDHEPDLTIYLDIPPDVSMERVVERRQYRTKSETRNARLTLERVYKAYQTYAVRHPFDWKSVDATQPIGDVYKAVLKHIKSHMAPFEEGGDEY